MVKARQLSSITTSNTRNTPNTLTATVTSGTDDSIANKTSNTTPKSPSLTITWDELPTWQQDNHYIRTGYRPTSSSFYKSFASLGYLHNESVNIYSHLLGALFFAFLGSVLYHCVIIRQSINYYAHYQYYSYFSHYYDMIDKGKIDPSISAATFARPMSSMESIVFSCFFAGIISCLAISGTYHSISNHSPTVARWGNKMDYVGIVCLIVGSFIPSIFYGFYCHPTLQKLYCNMISTLGLACAAVTIFDRFRTPSWRPYRAAMFIAMGLSAVFPVIHGLKIYGFHTMRSRMGLIGILLEGFFYILGACIYAARWPERSRPGYFDIWGSSHQIFHILVLIAAGFHVYSLRTAYNFHHYVIETKCVL